LAGLCPDLLGELTTLPDFLAGLRGLLLKGGDGRSGERKEGKGYPSSFSFPRMKILAMAQPTSKLILL